MKGHRQINRCYQIAAAFAVVAAIGCSAPKFSAIDPVLSSNNGLGDQESPDPSATPSPTPSESATPTPEPTPAGPVQQGQTSFTQENGSDQVDILIVDDNSTSMYTEQQKMAQRFSSFMSSIADLDYHIGMTTTDAEASGASRQAELLKWAGTNSNVMTPATLNASEAFSKTIARKETLDCPTGFGFGCASGDEQPIKNVMQALDGRNTFNAGFFRDNADLIVIILSDEDEASTGGSGATRGSALINKFQSIYGTSKNLQVHGIVVRPGDANCLAIQRAQAANDLGSQYGRFVAELAGLTGGIVGDICADDYSSQLAQISREARKLITSVDLGHVPVVGSVKVTLTPAESISFTIEGTKLIFERPPAPGTKVEIDYEY